jgi:hypothetical protein
MGNLVVLVHAPSLWNRPFHCHLKKAEDSVDMAFHQCIDCQNLFRADEKKCPNCGKPVVPRPGRERLAVGALLTLVVTLGVVGYQLAASQRSDLKPPPALSEMRDAAVLPPPEAFEPPVDPLEEQYSKLVAFLDEGQFEKAADTLSIIKDLNGLHYRDTPLHAKRVMIHGLEEDARRIPAGKIAENIAAYQRLLAMDPGNGVYRQKIAFYEARRRDLRVQAQERDKGPTEKLNDQKEDASASAERLVGVPF